MSDVPLTRTKLKAAKRPAAASRPLVSTGEAVAACRQQPFTPSAESPRLPRRPELATTLIPEKARQAASRTGGLSGCTDWSAVLVCMSQVAVQEAPAWGLSMVVHMVTLVTMAMVAVPDAVPCKAQHFVVAPPEEAADRRGQGHLRQTAGDAGRELPSPRSVRDRLRTSTRRR